MQDDDDIEDDDIEKETVNVQAVVAGHSRGKKKAMSTYPKVAFNPRFRSPMPAFEMYWR